MRPLSVGRVQTPFHPAHNYSEIQIFCKEIAERISFHPRLPRPGLGEAFWSDTALKRDTKRYAAMRSRADLAAGRTDHERV
jgi:hypothetical protein